MFSIRRWVFATFILTFLVIIAGGVVRTTQSGMGCPDWPTCFGKWVPPTTASELPPDFEKYLRKQDIDHSFNALHTWIEYFNRLLGALLGVFAVIQSLLLFFRRKEQRLSFRLAMAFLALVVLTGLLGAIVVKLNLAHVSISLHLLFAILLLQLQLALLLSLRSRLSYWVVEKSLQTKLFIFLVVLLIHSVIGTGVRIYVDDISKMLSYEQREAWLAQMPVSFLWHRSFSWVVLMGAIGVSWYSRNNMHIRKPAFILTGIIVGNMLAGITLYYANMPAILQPIHLFLAACAITQTMFILLQVSTQPILKSTL